MAINKNFVIKNGVEVNTSLIVGDATLNKVGVGTTIPHYTLHVGGISAGFGATDATITGIATIGVANSEAAALSVLGVSTFQGDVNLVGSAGITTITFDASTDRLKFSDNAKAAFGADSDLVIFHDGSDSRIREQGTGNLIIEGDDSGSDETLAVFKPGGAVELYHDDTKRLETTGYGVTVFDTLQSKQINVTGVGTIQNLNVTGLSTFSGIATFRETVSVASTLFVGGVQVTGGGAVIGLDIVTRHIRASGVSTFVGNVFANNHLVVGASASITNNLSVSGVSTFSDDLAVGVSTLFADVSTGRIGIGTDAPAHRLQVLTDQAGEVFSVRNGGIRVTGVATATSGGKFAQIDVGKSNINGITGDVNLTLDAGGGTGGAVIIEADVGLQASGNLRVAGISSFVGIASFASGVGIADSIFHLEDTNTAIRFPSNDTVTVEIAGTEELRINETGVNIAGITTSDGLVLAEDDALHFRGTAADDVDAILRESSSGKLLINSRNDVLINIDSNNDETERFFAVGHDASTGSSGEILRVVESGHVGIGTTNAISDNITDALGTNTKVLAVGIVTANQVFSSGIEITGGGSVIGLDVRTRNLNASGISTLQSTVFANGALIVGAAASIAGITSVQSLSIGSTSVIDRNFQLQNIASLDATTTATIESAIANAPNTFTDLTVTGITTLGIASATNFTADNVNVSLATTTNILAVTGIATAETLQVGNLGLNVTGVSTFVGFSTFSDSVFVQDNLNVAGITTVQSLSIGSTSVIDRNFQLQNIASLDATTTATIESAIAAAPNNFNDLKITGLSTFIGIATFGSGVGIADSIFHLEDTNTAIRFPDADTFTVETGGSQALRIDSSQIVSVNNPNAIYSSSDNFVVHNIDAGARIGLQRQDSGQVTAGEELGALSFYSNDGDVNPSARMLVQADDDHAVGDKPGRIIFQTVPDGSATLTERLRITSSGNIGIGTDNPAEELHLNLPEPTIRLEDSDNNAFAQVNASNGNLRFDADQGNTFANSEIAFRIDGTQVLEIINANDIGVVLGGGATVGSSSGVVTYFGDGSNLTGVIAGVNISADQGIVGAAITNIKFTGSGISTVTTDTTVGIATINITGGGGGGGGVTETDTTVSTISATGVGSFAVATHRSAAIIAQIDQDASYQVGRYLMIHDGTTATLIEESAIATGDMLGSFTADVNNSNAELKVTMNSSGIATVTTKIDTVTI